MPEQMIALLKANDMCVLATCRDQRPHCSLMAYVTDEEGLTVYMATRRDTTKFRNVQENPRVSLLVDTRLQGGADRARIQSLTVEGLYTPLHDAGEESRVRDVLRRRHPHIHGLLDHPLSVLMPVKVLSFLLLDGPEKASHVRVVPE
ncbi:MAG: pyridoxamine 5'-phosphate oxidase family protein [Desulfosoma sp.]